MNQIGEALSVTTLCFGLSAGPGSSTGRCCRSLIAPPRYLLLYFCVPSVDGMRDRDVNRSVTVCVNILT